MEQPPEIPCAIDAHKPVLVLQLRQRLPPRGTVVLGIVSHGPRQQLRGSDVGGKQHECERQPASMRPKKTRFLTCSSWRRRDWGTGLVPSWQARLRSMSARQTCATGNHHRQ